MILDLGIIEYKDAWRMQRELAEKRRCGAIQDSIMLVEHPAVFTIGRSGSRANLLADETALKARRIEVLDVDRGGDITFHSPGQIVLYAILDLKERYKDLHKYLNSLEDVAIGFLARYGIRAARVPDATGVWAEGAKIASIGVAARDWVTYHGLSVNVNNDTAFFSMMNPCGMPGLEVTSVKQILGHDVDMAAAKRVLADEFNKIFGVEGAFSDHRYASGLA
jgi:lipoate-protein ligase B